MTAGPATYERDHHVKSPTDRSAHELYNHNSIKGSPSGMMKVN